MDRETFLSESMKYIISLEEELGSAKEQLLEIFDVFHGICRDNDITYFLVYGTLLGLVRDGELIPWDYDLDVCVPITSVHKLISSLQTQLPEGYTFECNYTNKHYPFYQLRIGRRDFPVECVHLDVYYLIGAPKEDGVPQFIRENRELFFKSIDFSRVEEPRYEGQGSVEWFCKKLYFWIRTGFATRRSLNRRFEKLANMYSFGEADHYFIFSDATSCIPKDVMVPAGYRDFHGNRAGVPNKEDEILEIWYKGHNKYLPIDNRFHEFYINIIKYRTLMGETKKVDYRELGNY